VLVESVEQLKCLIHDAPAELNFHIFIVNDALRVLPIILVRHLVYFTANGLFG
jgi:hypothetical protein